MAQYDDDVPALQVSMRGREQHSRILPHLPEATGISYGYRQPLCGMPGARTDPSDPSVLRSASDGR
ncbi:hypothetical protein FQE99_24470 [Escherichia coli]|uniref:Uncharacterized protein n=1 Tax=Escherichia coli TaxID=562 RepID=A0A8S7N672_ECOLX|nr:hypothetical protein [Escherichia coli]EEW2390617.1 hypothetical protein [Escherichia coli]EFA5131972.1 hypothetical protein [Escherichia coli]EFB4728986.1 hypothetical protein [Escherichia coli]EFE8675865.1 hypothetical protein [Escherichia coli]